jgi:hypothetical protein
MPSTGKIKGSQQWHSLFAQGGNVAANTTEGMSSLLSTKTS